MQNLMLEVYKGLCQFRNLEQQIIIMNKEQYLSYFKNSPPATKNEKEESKSAHLQRPKTSHYCVSKTKKLLPHIIEEYQYRITNELLTEKITHPKRDKIIAQSFTNHQQKRDEKSKKKTVLKLRSQQKENQQQRGPTKKQNQSGFEGKRQKRGGKTCQIERLYKTFDDINSSCFNYKNDYLISLENNRMGKRIINTRSMVQDILTKTYYTYQIYNGKIVNRDRYLKINRNSVKFKSCNKNFGKINNGIKCFFENIATEEGEKFNKDNEASTLPVSRTKTMHESSSGKLKDSQINMTHHGYETNNPKILETYGHGDLNFVINKLYIDSNPPIKADSILILQVIEKDQTLSQILNNYYAEKNNFVAHTCPTEQTQDESHSNSCHTTASFPYEYISTEREGSFGLKFKLRFRSHIYLRVMKAEGLNQREVGVVRLSLEPFRTRVADEFPFKIVKQIRNINGLDHCRQIYESQFSGNFYRFKKGEIPTTIRLTYQLYFRSFKKYKQIQPEDISSTINSN